MWQLREFNGVEGGAERQMRPLEARGTAELRKVASDSATPGLWLRNRKVGSQVIGEYRSRLPGRSTVRKVMEEEDEEEETATERTREYTYSESDLGEREREMNISPAMFQPWPCQ